MYMYKSLSLSVYIYIYVYYFLGHSTDGTAAGPKSFSGKVEARRLPVSVMEKQNIYR